MTAQRLVAACEPGWEAAVCCDWTRQFPHSAPQAAEPGWVVATLTDDDLQSRRFPPLAALAGQVLPRATEIVQPSISQFAAAIADEIARRLDAHPGPWRWHVFRVESDARNSPGQQRCVLIEQAVRERLSQRFRRLAKRGHAESRATFDAQESLVQFGLRTERCGELSILLPDELAVWKHAVSGFRGGDLEVPWDEAAPSRACQKLYEVELRWGRRIAKGESCVDLGSSPGGWAWVALRRGASVTAVDRSPLRDDLMRQPRLTFARGDAFQFRPEKPVDWLLSDVVAFPSRILELLRTWLVNGWCRHFCVTIKFRGREDYPRLSEFAELLAQHTSTFELRRLKVNGNEVTAVGSRD